MFGHYDVWYKRGKNARNIYLYWEIFFEMGGLEALSFLGGANNGFCKGHMNKGKEYLQICNTI